MLPSGIKNSQYQCTIATGLVSKSGHAFYAMQLTAQWVYILSGDHTAIPNREIPVMKTGTLQ